MSFTRWSSSSKRFMSSERMRTWNRSRAFCAIRVTCAISLADAPEIGALLAYISVIFLRPAVSGEEIRGFRVLEERVLARGEAGALVGRERRNPARIVAVDFVGQTDEAGEVFRAYDVDDIHGIPWRVVVFAAGAMTRPISA